MIECTRNKSMVIVLIIILFASPYLCAQGLRFYGNKVPIEQRTSYKLFNEEFLPVFSDYIDIEFSLRISQSRTFGYLFHMVNPANNDAYSLTYSYVNDKTSVFKFNTEGKVNHISMNFLNDSVISQWLPVKLHIDFETGGSVLTIGTKVAKGVIRLANRPQKIQPILSFGRREYLVDVPAFSIQKLKISSKGQTYFFKLNESIGHEVHDSNGDIQGTVVNPYWLINDSYHWTKVATFVTSPCMGSKFNVKRQEIEFITSDSLFIYQVNAKHSLKKPYANSMPVHMLLGTSFINGADGKLYAYEINNLPINSLTMAALDLSTLLWQPVGRAFTKVQLHHHNGLWDNHRNRYMVFGGFGSRSYSNKFLTYNQISDRWDTLQFKGDKLTPRFFSSMTPSKQGNYLYIYGGVGNESGDQSIGQNYYNDLYRIDLERHTIKLLWNHPIDEKRVPSEQMILSDDGKSLYVIRYAQYIKYTSLQLYRISIADGKMEQLGDSIPFVSGSIVSTVSLYYNPILKEFYCVTQEVNEDDNWVKANVYELSAPPVSRAKMEYYSVKNKSSGLSRILLLGICIVISGSLGVWIFFYRRKRQRRKNDVPDFVPDKIYHKASMDEGNHEVLLNKASLQVAMKRKEKECNRIYIYGIFTIYNRSGRDITYLFSKKLKYLFLYILLNSTGREKGVHSYALNEIFWPDKSEDKAKNLKGVTISNLRKALMELDGIKLLNEKGVFSIMIKEDICFCDYFSMYASWTNHPQSCDILLPIWERGKLLESEESLLFDKYKQNSENIILSLLPKDLPTYYQQNAYSYVLRICFVILKRDPLNEQALYYCVHSYKNLNDFENLSKIYSTFIIEYRKSMGEDFPHTIEELLHAKEPI
ncbi:MAG: hypothetical protein LKI39_00610 [Bacteroides sp.]|nr:hypothetical protein [Bacteroides sp.]